MTCTIFENIFSKSPRYITVDDALSRITQGKSKALIEKIRATTDKEKVQKMKYYLPSICFSGYFGKERTDDSLVKHSGFIVLDFDNVSDIRNKQTEIISNDFVYACWVSPSGTGLKVLIRVADGGKHKEHFQALQEIFPEIDKSGINPSRVCYESYDTEIYIYPDAAIFTKTKTIEKIVLKESTTDEERIFNNLVKWLSNKKEAFVTGERNNFIFKLAAACCRYGVHETTTQNLINTNFISTSDFSQSESNRAIKSAYKANVAKFGDSVFEKDILINRETRSEIKIDATVFDEGLKLKDVIYGVGEADSGYM